MEFNHKKREKKVVYFNVLYLMSTGVFFIYILKFNFLHHVSEFNTLLLSVGACLAGLPLVAIQLWGIRSVAARVTVCSVITVATGVLIYISGGMQAPGLIWICSVPVLFGVLLGVTWAVWLNVLTLLFLVLLFVLHQNGYVVNALEGRIDYINEKFTSVILFMVFSGFSTIYIAWDERKSVLRLRQKHHDVENLLRALLHDVANGLSAMTYNIIRAREDHTDPEKSSPNLDRMETSIDNISNLLDQVRKIKAIKDGKADMVLQRVPLKSLIDEACKKVQEASSRKGVSMVYNSPPKSIFAQVEKSLFVDIILCNLLSNAIKFSSSGDEIKISLEVTEEHISVEIRDYGIGMPKNILSNIFRMDSPTTRQGTGGEKGTGYGMPLVREYLQMMEGSIEVYSKEVSTPDFARGTRVVIRLPVT